MSTWDDRLESSRFENDPVVGVFFDDVDRAVWVPERLFVRLTSIAAGYELHLLPLLGGSERVRLDRQQIDGLLDELEFVSARVRDPLLEDWISLLDETIRSSMTSSSTLHVEGE